MLRKFLNDLPYTILIPIALLLGLAPFHPEPHLVEKLRLLHDRQLTRPIDIFDLMLHSAPLLLLAAKVLLSRWPVSPDKSTGTDPDD